MLLDEYFWETLPEVVDDVVIRNAHTLCTLHLGSKRLPFNPKQPVVFRNLRDLECSLNPHGESVLAAVCPRLVKLKADIFGTRTIEALQEIPAESLTSLHITRVSVRTNSHEEIGQLVAAFSAIHATETPGSGLLLSILAFLPVSVD